MILEHCNLVSELHDLHPVLLVSFLNDLVVAQLLFLLLLLLVGIRLLLHIVVHHLDLSLFLTFLDFLQHEFNGIISLIKLFSFFLFEVLRN